MIFIAIIFSLGYFCLLIWFLKGWLNLKISNKLVDEPKTGFSIIVPARNEQYNILNTINDLVSQVYPGELFEVIIVDDDSTDQTYQLANERFEDLKLLYPNFSLFRVPSEQIYSSGHKKRAIEYGISLAKFEWIVTSDADCRRSKYWLQSLAGYIEHEKPVLVSAPVLFHQEKSFFDKIQSLEFMSLVGMGAAAIGNNSPNLCNGANLTYKKSAFLEVGGFSDNIDLSSGDDEFLMHKIAAYYPGNIGFLKNKEAFVFTKAPKTLHEFIQQRKRWVSKSTKYRKKEVFALLLFVYVFHFLVLTTGLLSIFSLYFLFPFLILLGMKICAECILVIPLARYFAKLHLMPFYPIAAVLYVIYVVSIGIIGNSGKYTWKGRQVT